MRFAPDMHLFSTVCQVNYLVSALVDRGVTVEHGYGDDISFQPHGCMCDDPVCYRHIFKKTWSTCFEVDFLRIKDDFFNCVNHAIRHKRVSLDFIGNYSLSRFKK